jgi:radical SAM superfamily enzyme YgiQ (UPF0313 family)
MWIKLISPKVTMRPMDSAFKRQMAPPLSLLILHALTPEGHRVTIADENVERLNFDDRPDLVGITVKADTAFRSWDIARSYRQKGIPVVLGGIYPTTCPEENEQHADACVIGEAEELWGTVLHDVAAGSLKKVYRTGQPPDLSLTPIPQWDAIAGKRYLYTNTLTIGRGCPWRCAFCYNSSPNLPAGYRTKPVHRILQEITSLRTRHVMFIDDNFIASPPFARELLGALLPLGLTWHTAVSADIGRHDDILDLMAASGCRSLFIGFETLNPANLLAANKRQNHIEEYERTVSKIHSHGMMVNASVVFGFDEDGPEVFDDTTRWLIDREIETMTAHILTPYPGTALHARLRAENRIFDHDLTHYNTSHAVFHPAGMTAKQLEAGYLGSYRQFYSWKNILQRMPSEMQRGVPYLLFNLFYRKYGRAASALGAIGLMRSLGNLGAWISYPRLRVEHLKTKGQEVNAMKVEMPTISCAGKHH